MVYTHVPVMLAEILEYLAPRPGQKFVDCTLGGAGYTLALAEKVGGTGKILALDLDDLALANAARLIKEKKLSDIVLVKSNFKKLAAVVSKTFPAGTKFDGIVFDLGLSSAQLDDEARGFSFKGDRPLDMAFGSDEDNSENQLENSETETETEVRQSTEQIVNNYSIQELTDIFRLYGEEKRSYSIAKAIVDARKIKRIRTTADLTEIIESVVPLRFRSRIHPATKIFQALRMETNRELEALKTVLPDALELLKPNGRLVIVSFHSGEDRIVKRFFKENAISDPARVKILTKRPLIPSEEETDSNPRARSAKLRAAQKIR